MLHARQARWLVPAWRGAPSAKPVTTETWPCDCTGASTFDHDVRSGSV